MMKSFRDKVVLITGGSSGLGHALASLLATEGAHLALAARRGPRLRAVAEEISATHQSVVRTYIVDLERPQDAAAVVESARRDLGSIDVLINNAGVGLFSEVVDTSRSDFERLMTVNFMSAVAMTHAVLPDMLSRGSGHIVNVGSIAGRRAFKRTGAYAASKFALTGFSHVLRQELASSGIGVTLLCPPAFMSEFFEAAGYDNYWEHHPRARQLTSREVAVIALEAVRRNKREEIVTARQKALDKLNAVAGGFTEWLNNTVASIVNGGVSSAHRRR